MTSIHNRGSEYTVPDGATGIDRDVDQNWVQNGYDR